MENQIECFYQPKIKLNKGFDSEFVLPRLEENEDIQRLIIHAPEGKFEHLLEKLNFKSYWIVFSSEPVENFKTCNLSWFKKWRLIGITDHSSLFYTISESLGVLKDVDESIIWRYGGGISLPIKEPNSIEIEKAIDIQIGIKKNLIEAIMCYKCVVIANRDGYGVNVIWSSSWEFSKEITDWAIKLTDKYKWEGNPFIRD
jgi:hypothetical protein